MNGWESLSILNFAQKGLHWRRVIGAGLFILFISMLGSLGIGGFHTPGRRGECCIMQEVPHSCIVYMAVVLHIPQVKAATTWFVPMNTEEPNVIHLLSSHAWGL
jgi:hypothetical protein